MRLCGKPSKFWENCAGSRSPHQTPRTPHFKCYQLQHGESRKREEQTVGREGEDDTRGNEKKEETRREK